MLKIARGASKRFRYVAPIAELETADELKDQGLQTPGFVLQMVVRASIDATTNLILKTSANPAQIEIVSSVLAYIYFVPADTLAIALPVDETGIDLWYGFGIGNGSLNNTPITPFEEFRVTRSLV